MPRILGVDVPNDKKIQISLQYLYGVGAYRAKVICKETNIDPDTRARDLREDDVARLAAFIDKQYNEDEVGEVKPGTVGRRGPVEGALRRTVMQNIQRLKKIGCYRGIRHVRGLPVRGQRTKTNARTRKGKKKTVATKVSVKQMR